MKSTYATLSGLQGSALAPLLMLAAMSIIGVIDNLIAVIARDMGLWQFYFLRGLMALPCVLVLSRIGLGRWQPAKWRAVALRAVLLSVAMVFYFSALAFMPIAQALAGLFTAPIFILVISTLFLGQRIGVFRISAVLVGFVGVLSVLKPDPADFDILILLPMLGGLFYALAMLATRGFCADETAVSMLGGMLLAQTLMGAGGLVALTVWPQDAALGGDGFALRGWIWPIWHVMPLLVIQAVGSVLGVFLITKAYQVGEVTSVAVFEYSVMIVGPGFAWLVFGQVLDLSQMFGICLIIAAGVTIVLRTRAT
jgi:drug/metabolite transporter (DMT)-like permease